MILLQKKNKKIKTGICKAWINTNKNNVVNNEAQVPLYFSIVSPKIKSVIK